MVLRHRVRFVKADTHPIRIKLNASIAFLTQTKHV